jgi:Tol biopolymer transport system component
MKNVALTSAYLIPFFLICCKRESPLVSPLTTDDSLVTVERELTDGQQPAVSPDGKRIAYTYNGDIYIMDTSGTNITQLTRGEDVDFMPRWHPNGVTIGFARLTVGETEDARIFEIASAGASVHEILTAHYLSDRLRRQTEKYSGNGIPLWDFSPNGNCIAFLSYESGKTYLNVVDIASHQQVLYRQIYDDATGINGNSASFAWSSTSNKIAFTGENELRTTYVYLLNLIDSTLAIDSTFRDASSVTRSPSSERFAYNAGGPSAGGPFINVTDFSALKEKYSLQGGGNARWSPDEKYFVVNWQGRVSGPDGYEFSRMYIYNIEKQKEFVLTNRGDINRNNFYYEWAAAPRTIFFERFGKVCKITFSFSAQ